MGKGYLFVLIILVIFLIVGFIVVKQPRESSEITDIWCDAVNNCPADLECFNFPNIGLRCAQPNPCSYYECPLGTKCTILEILPAKIICSPTEVSTVSECIKNEQKQTTQPYVKGEVIIGFKDDTTKENAVSLIQTNGLTIKDERLWSSIHSLVVKVPDGSEIEWVCQLRNNDIVKYAELNGIGVAVY